MGPPGRSPVPLHGRQFTERLWLSVESSFQVPGDLDSHPNRCLILHACVDYSLSNASVCIGSLLSEVAGRGETLAPHQS